MVMTVDSGQRANMGWAEEFPPAKHGPILTPGTQHRARQPDKEEFRLQRRQRLLTSCV